MPEQSDDRPPAARLLDRKVLSIDRGLGEVRLSFDAPMEFTNRHGTIQGGFLAAMLDSAAANALLATLPANMTAVTTRLDTRFLAPAEVGRLDAIARVISSTDRSALVHAELLDAGRRSVAVADAEMRIVERRGSTGA